MIDSCGLERVGIAKRAGWSPVRLCHTSAATAGPGRLASPLLLGDSLGIVAAAQSKRVPDGPLGNV